MPFHTFRQQSLIYKKSGYSLLEYFQTSFSTNWENSSIDHRLPPICMRLGGSDELWVQVGSFKNDRTISQGFINSDLVGPMGISNFLQETYRSAPHRVD